MQQLDDPCKLPLQGQVLIEASAGTGKTFTIGLLYLRLLLELNLQVDQILVVTFTKAATEELRSRIRVRIREALDVLEGRSRQEDAALTSLLHKIEGPEKAVVRLQDGLTRMDEAAVFTIHSFCQRMLQEHAFESGAPFEMEFLESEQHLCREIMEDFWRQRLYTAPPEEAARVKSFWNTPEELRKSLGGHLGRTDVVCVPDVDRTQLARQLEDMHSLFVDIQAMWQRQGNEIQQILRHYMDNGWLKKTVFKDATFMVALDEMEKLGSGAQMPVKLKKQVKLFSLEIITAQLTKKKQGEPPEHPFFDLFATFFHQLPDMIQKWKIAFVQDGRKFHQTELIRRKAARDQLYFNDLLTCLDEALSGPTGGQLASRIAARFPVIMVDEFQDTDPVQYRIFRAIHRSKGHTGMVLIGDPKQAIYGFRGADIFTYFKAKTDTPSAGQFTMNTNYRSSSGMVTMVNRLFRRDSPFNLTEDVIGFPRVGPCENADSEPFSIDGQRVAALNCLLLHNPDDEDTLLKKGEADTLAPGQCARQIAELLAQGRSGKARIGERRLRAGDIAVLVRTHREGESIRLALSQSGISSVYLSRQSVFASDEAIQILYLLTALGRPSEASLVRSALVTDLFGYDAEVLDTLQNDETLWEQVMAKVFNYAKTWKNEGFSSMFQAVIAGQNVVSRLHGLPGGERKLTNFLHLAELLQEQCRNLTGTDKLLSWLSENIHSDDEASESQQLRLESDENLVQIVTIHKAKGLEYPLVFLPFVWSTRVNKKNDILTFHRSGKYDALTIDLGSGDAESLRLAEQERLAEDLRMLYVALTRARNCCYFSWGCIRYLEKTALCYLLHKGRRPASLAELVLELGACEEGPDSLAIFDVGLQGPEGTSLVESAADTFTPVVRKFTGHIDTSWQITSYSRLVAHADRNPERPDYDQFVAAQQSVRQHDVFGFPRGAAAGTCLHSILEQVDFADLSQADQTVYDQLERAGIDRDWAGVVRGWLKDIMATELEPGFSLSCLQNRDRINEMSFYFPLRGVSLARFNAVLAEYGIQQLPANQRELQGLMVGFIDLIYCWQGRYYVADYKSNHLGNSVEAYGQDTMSEAMREHTYDVQYLIYTLALHRYLLTRIAGYSYEQHIGGVFYLFLRGMQPGSGAKTGVFNTLPPYELIRRLDQCCEGEKG